MMPLDVSTPPIDWKEWLTKASLTGLVAAAGSYVLAGDSGRSFNLAGVGIPGYVIMGLGGAAGSLSADMAHQWVFPFIPHNAKYDKAEAAALSVAASGLGFYAAGLVLGPSAPALLPSMAIGSGSFLVSDYAWHNFISKKDGGLLF
jgi:hypothetical protein